MNISTLMQRALRPSQKAYAHCDIPCGIYDPATAQLGAETVEKMMTLMDAADAGNINSMARYIAIKEQHAEMKIQEERHSMQRAMEAQVTACPQRAQPRAPGVVA